MNRADIATVRAMFEAFVDPLLLLDGEMRVIRFNRSGEIHFGKSAVGQHVSRLISTPQLLGAVEAALRGRTPDPVEWVYPGNIEHTYNVSVQPIYVSSDAGMPRVMLAMHEITALRRSEQLRVDFLSNASHELKTPLASLLGFIETLQGPAKEDTEAREKFLAIMHSQASRMTRLVNDLLSLARIEFSEHVIPTDQVDIATLARQAMAQLEAKAAQRGVTLKLNPAKKLPKVPGDSDQIMQLLQNLIENAIKYTHDNTPVEVTLKVEADRLHLIVQDHGPGIAREHLPRLTERFYRIDAGRSRSTGGTGLGLSIVKHIVNRHRGTFLVESELGQGSTFSVVLPLTPHPD